MQWQGNSPQYIHPQGTLTQKPRTFIVDTTVSCMLARQVLLPALPTLLFPSLSHTAPSKLRLQCAQTMRVESHLAATASPPAVVGAVACQLFLLVWKADCTVLVAAALPLSHEDAAAEAAGSTCE